MRATPIEERLIIEGYAFLHRIQDAWEEHDHDVLDCERCAELFATLHTLANHLGMLGCDVVFTPAMRKAEHAWDLRIYTRDPAPDDGPEPCHVTDRRAS